MLTFGIDFDDVLCDLNSHAVEMANWDHPMDPPLRLEELDSWELSGRAQIVKGYYDREDLYLKQSVTREARDFVWALQEQGEVFICTSIRPEFMGLRVRQIREAFPFIPEDHIIMGSRKSLLQFDVTLDDGGHNILESRSRFPVLFRKPWNHRITGIMAVNSYADFLELLKQIKHSLVQGRRTVTAPAVVALVGPSGAGKRTLAKALSCREGFVVPENYTTNPDAGAHRYLSEKTFLETDFLETTYYGGYRYGTKKEDLERCLETGKYLVLPMDICGAISMKRFFPTLLVYCKARKETIIGNILEKNLSLEEKKLRLINLDKELLNEQICDCVIDMENGNPVRELMKHLY